MCWHTKTLITYVLLALASASAMGQMQPSQPDLNTILIRLEKAQAENRQALRAYALMREYRLFSKDSQTPSSEVIAQVNFVPPDNKTFHIAKVTGTSRGEKIARSLLEREVEAPKEPKQSTLLTRESYDFTYQGTTSVEGHPCYVLELHPKYKRPNLIEGRVWVDQASYLPRYAEGDLSRTPSWWIRKVHVTLSFRDLDGMWLVTDTQAVATVRWFGEHTLTSRTTDFRAATSVAQRHWPTPVPSRTER